MAKKQQAQPKDFEQAVAELESILRALESDETTLEESLVKYERGNWLIRFARDALAAAEKQIEQLTENRDGTLAPESDPDDTPPEHLHDADAADNA